MQALVMDVGDRITIQAANNATNMDSFRKLGFLIQDANGDNLQLKPFHFGWATQDEIDMLVIIIEEHNKR